MKLDFYTVGQRIRRLRRRKNLSQAKLSEMVDVSTTYISHLENGMKFMSVETLIALANALGVSTDAILCDSLDQQLSACVTEFEVILRDCTNFERRVILDNARGIKKALRDNKYLK
ncbi:MAG: helix-turn-helix transcriptional regulator [Muribaculaceae bacterium]|nr:helix-turn-helix transcriptional regulator [Muribaculaceae bacterium]